MYCMFIWLLGPLKVVTVVSSAQKPAFYVHMCSLAALPMLFEEKET